MEHTGNTIRRFNEGHAAPIELACEIGGRFFAFEHTGIEPFEDHIRLEVDASTLFQEIEGKVLDVVPTAEDITLLIQLHALRELSKRELPRVQEALVHWIRTTVPTWPVAPLGRFTTPINWVSILGVPTTALFLRDHSYVS